jgi:anaerobic selenocysteine-containing dehydrogenase
LVLLTSERDKNYHHSRFRDQQWLRDQIPYPISRIHPRTATSLGLADGTWVSIETSDGPASSKAQLDYSERVLPSVVSTGMGWRFPEAAGPDFGNSAVNINNALAYGAPFDPVVGSADSRGLACRLAQTSPP